MEDAFIENTASLHDSPRQTIAEHAAQCRSLFHRYMEIPETVPDTSIIDDQQARFVSWTAEIIYGPLNAFLDYRLRSSPALVEIMHHILDLICGT